MDSITDFITLILSNIWLYAVPFLAVLSVLVIVHEWGHYAMARLCGVRVDEFAVGMGREIWGRTGRDGTRWKICLLPIGGYVKMFGDADPAGASKTDQVGEGSTARMMTPSERDQAFFSKTVGQRAAIVFAGPAINFIFAIVVLTGLFITQGREITPPVIAAVQVESAGDLGGLRPGDHIVSLNGKQAESFDDLKRTVMLALDQPIEIMVDRAGQVETLHIAAKRVDDLDRFGFKHQRGYLGVLGPSNGFDLKTITAVAGVDTAKNINKTRSLLLSHIGKGPFIVSVEGLGDIKSVRVDPSMAQNGDLKIPGAPHYGAFVPYGGNVKEYKKYSLFSGIIQATYQTYRISVDSLGALGQMITGVRSATELGGVIRIGTLASDMAQAGFIAILTFTALLSINLGLINLFPIPMLDGGHLAFYAYESMRGKPMPDHFQDYAFRFGLVVLVFLMVFSNLNDILQLVL